MNALKSVLVKCVRTRPALSTVVALLAFGSSLPAGLQADQTFSNTQIATGDINNSGPDTVLFTDNASAGASTIINSNGGVLRFEGNARGGTALIRNEAQGSGTSGTAIFTGNASAENAVINNTNSSLIFSGNSSLGSAGLTSANNPAHPSDPQSIVTFKDYASAGTGNISNQNGSILRFTGWSTASGAKVTNDALLDISGMSATELEIGKLNGSGNINLGAKNLTVGALPLLPLEVATISGTIMGSGDFTKTGASTLYLSGTNTYTGKTTISSGTLILDRVNAIASSSSVELSSYATLKLEANNILNNFVGADSSVVLLGSNTATFNNNNDGWVASNINGTGGVIKTGNGSTIFSASNNYTGGLYIKGGTVEYYDYTDGHAAELGGAGNSIILDGGTILGGNHLTLDNSRAVSLGAAGGTLIGRITINHGIDGDGQLNVTSNSYRHGDVTLAGNNTYTGATVVNGNSEWASLMITGTLLNQGGLTIIDGGVDVGDYMEAASKGRVDGKIDVAKGNLSYYGESVGSGTITTGTGGPRRVSGGSTFATAATSFNDTASSANATINIKSDGELSYWGASTAGTSTITNDGGVIFFATSATDAAALASITNNASATDATSGFLSIYTYAPRSLAVGHLNGSGNIYLASTMLVIGGLDNRAMTISGTIVSTSDSGYLAGLPGGIKKVGDTSKLTLTGTNTYFGATIVAGGNLTLGAANVIANSHKVEITGSATLAVEASNIINNLTSDSPNATLALSNGATANLRSTPFEAIDESSSLVTLSSGTTTYAGKITGNGAINKTGQGTLTLSGSNSYTGGTTITEGNLVVTSNAALGAATGGLRFDGDLTAVTLTLGGDVAADNRAVTVERVNNPNPSPTILSAIIYTAGHKLTIGNGLAGDGSLQFTGGGTVALSGSVTHTAYTFITDNTTLALNAAGGANSRFEAYGAGSTINVTGTAFVGTLYSATSGRINFANGASAATSNVILTDNGTATFQGNATAGHALLWGIESAITFTGSSNAGSSEIRNVVGTLRFTDNSSANNALIDNTSGGWGISATTVFGNDSTAGTSTIENRNSVLLFTGSATANNTVINNTNYFASDPNAILNISGLGSNGITVGNLSSDGLIILGNKTLTIGSLNHDMWVSGTISGAGALVKSGSGTLTLNGINTHTGGVRVNGGKLLLASDAALGASTGTLTLDGGALVYGSAFNLASTRSVALGASGGAIDTNNKNVSITQGITGSGALAKKGAGTLTLNGVNTYTGATTIETGALQIGDASHTSASLKSNVTINNGATLAGYGTVIGNVTNNGTVSFGDAFEQPALQAPFMRTMLLSAPAPLHNYTIQGNLTNNNLLKLGRAGGTPGNALTVTGNYNGDGTIRMNTDFSTGATDRLIVQGTTSGTIQLWVNNTTPSGAKVSEDTQIDLLTLPSSSATINLTNGTQTIDSIEIGMITFNAAMRGNSFRLLSTTRQSNAADAILSTASIAGAEWHYDLDSASKRMGDLRATQSTTDGTHDGSVWIRANTYRLNADASLSGASFHEYVNVISAGADCTRPVGNGTLALGAYVNMGKVDRSFDNHGSGGTSNVGVGIYGTWLMNGGWYLDAVAKIDRNTNDFDAHAIDGAVTSAKYATVNQALSLEFGRQLKNAQGWWIEPGVQLALARLGGHNYTTTGAAALDVDVDSGLSTQYRFQVRSGKYLSAGRWNPYIKFAAAKNESDDRTVSVWGKNYAMNGDSWRAEFGGGASYLITPKSQVYLDYEYAKADNYERPYSFNIGYRRAW